jgi:hypothetical protein
MEWRGAERAVAAGAPWLGSYRDEQFCVLVREVGLVELHVVTAADLIDRYFRDRGDGLRPCSAEHILDASTTTNSKRR